MNSFIKGLLVGVCAITLAMSAFAERIIFVGDSITGQGENAKRSGWGALVREALESTSDQKGSDVILLGGSGHSVGSWAGILKKSKEKEVRLDAKKFDVKEEFEKGADKIVIMLGMNDVIGPYVQFNDKSIKSWEERYQKLIAGLKERVKPKGLGLATISMHTEDQNSYKNKLMDAMNDRIRELTKANGYMLMPVSEEYKKVFAEGRSYRPDFHITSDYVHPNGYGHMAIAVGMLEGLGKPKAAEYLRQKYYPNIKKNTTKGQKGISYLLTPKADNAPGKPQSFVIQANCYSFSDNDKVEIKATGPKGWTVTPDKVVGKGAFTVTGNPDKLRNIVKLSAIKDDKTYTCDAVINAPWLICAKISQHRWMYNKPLDVEKCTTDIDKAINAGQDFLKIPPKAKGNVPEWKLVYPSFDYTGGNNPDSIDFAAISADRCFDAGYGVRRILSPKAQKAQLNLQARLFAGNVFLTVWLNGKIVYQKELTREKGKKALVPVELKQGVNDLVFKSNHRAWLWQNSVGIEGPDGKPLDDLRYSVIGDAAFAP